MDNTNFFTMTWTSETGATVRELTFHQIESREVLDLPMPDGAVVREQTVQASGPRFNYYRRCPVQLGYRVKVDVNHAQFPGVVVAINNRTGQYLVEYSMPGGTTALKVMGWDNGRFRSSGVSYKGLSRRWRDLVAGGGVGLVENPQR